MPLYKTSWGVTLPSENTTPYDCKARPPRCAAITAVCFPLHVGRGYSPKHFVSLFDSGVADDRITRLLKYEFGPLPKMPRMGQGCFSYKSWVTEARTSLLLECIIWSRTYFWFCPLQYYYKIIILTLTVDRDGVRCRRGIFEGQKWPSGQGVGHSLKECHTDTSFLLSMPYETVRIEVWWASRFVMKLTWKVRQSVLVSDEKISYLKMLFGLYLKR